jgi:hypothetical protein
MNTDTNNDTEYNSIETQTDDEPSNASDVTGGGILGAVGGGIVGALAGGPIGAVIGAVIGGGASAIAIDAVDHHDHDSQATAESDYSTSPHPHFDGAGLAGAPEGSVYDGSFEPADRTYLVEEVAFIEEIDIHDLEEVTRLRAYQLWEERGHRDGFAEDDWLDAEKELSSLGGDASDYEDGGQPALVEEVILYR